MVVTMSEDHLTPSANPPVDVTSWTQATDPRDRSRAGIATRTKRRWTHMPYGRSRRAGVRRSAFWRSSPRFAYRI